MSTKTNRRLMAAMALILGSQGVVANTIPFSGNLPSQNALFEISFTLAATDSVTALTTSWDRPVSYCTTCGFDTVLWLFDADTGRPLPVSVRADITAAMGFVKLGCVLTAGAAFAGRVVEIDIGLPAAIHSRYFASPR